MLCLHRKHTSFAGGLNEAIYCFISFIFNGRMIEYDMNCVRGRTLNAVLKIKCILSNNTFEVLFNVLEINVEQVFKC